LPDPKSWAERGWYNIEGGGLGLVVFGGFTWRDWLAGGNIRGKRPCFVGSKYFGVLDDVVGTCGGWGWSIGCVGGGYGC